MMTFDGPRGDVGDAVAEKGDGTSLYESARTRISRRPWVRAAGSVSSTSASAGTTVRAVIWKEPLGPDAKPRRDHETGILTALAAVPGVAHLVPTNAPNDVPGGAPTDVPVGFALEDVGGVSLASTLTGPAETGWPVPDLVTLALRLARVLSGVHQAGVMHKDINPSNILITEPDRDPVLIDWDLATSFAEERPGFTHENAIAGTLPYLAPEQSGRTGRGVDQRADLYALGATLYQVAVGRPPFGKGDPLTLIHDHLARVPRPPRELNPAVPEMLSRIILRLLEKEPDRRYQSAAGLTHDLTRLQAGLTADPA